jgi:hypothetical protein
LIVPDEIFGAFERPVDLEIFRLIDDDPVPCIDSSGDQFSFVKGAQVSNLDSPQRNVDVRLDGRVRQKRVDSLEVISIYGFLGLQRKGRRQGFGSNTHGVLNGQNIRMFLTCGVYETTGS